MSDVLDAGRLPASAARTRGRAAPRFRALSLVEVALFAGIIGAAFGMRAVNVGAGSGDLDEGIFGMQVMLVGAGFRPYWDIYNSQGPLMLDLWHALYRAYGGGVEALRLAIGTYAVIGLGGTYWIGRQVAGPWGALAAALILLLSPTYLRISRQALTEMIALAPAVLAVGAALAYQRGGRRSWLLGAGVLLGISLAIKPITLAAAVPLGLAVLLRRERRLADLVLLGATAGAVVLASALAVGLDGVLEQTVEYRLRARDVLNWRLQDNWAILRGGLARDQLAVLGLAVAGTVSLLLVAPRDGLLLGSWTLASVGALLFYSPLFAKHAVTILPPVALLAGAGLARAWQVDRTGDRRLLAARLALALPLLWYLSTLPTLVRLDVGLMHLAPGAERTQFSDTADAVGSIRALTGPGEFVLTDHPYLAVLAQRLVPPALADSSKTRVRARELTGAEIVAAATAHPAPVAVLWTDRFRGLRAFGSWLDERYQAAKVYGKKGDSPRTIYVRRDGDLPRARRLLTADLGRVGAEFAAELRLAGAALGTSQLALGGSTSLALEWEAIQQPSVDYHVILKLSGPDGRVWDDEELSLFSRGEDAADWPPGRWVVQVSMLALPPEAPAGEYQVVIGVYDTKQRRLAPISRLPGGALPVADDEVAVAVLHVR